MNTQLRSVWRYALVCGTISFASCSLADLVDVDTPGDSITPEQITTAAGAMGLYGAAIGQMNLMYGAPYGDVVLAGVFTDEFQDTSVAGQWYDTRTISHFSGASLNERLFVYQGLHNVRMQGLQAAAAMRKFPDKIAPQLIGRVYAIVGYAELLLAERFCSGVPLAVIPSGGGTITYSAGVTTDQLIERAIAHFDTAISLSGTDSLRFLNLARVGKGRALMALGRYDDARSVVTAVPTEFVYNAEYSATTAGVDSNGVRPQTGGPIFTSNVGEGINGIDWAAAQDPRVPAKDVFRGTMRTSKYTSATSPITIADGIEARLIEAEADLGNDNANWLTVLNALRARVLNGDGSRALADTTDPGTAERRVNLLFRERAFWLYATGHRHGDLRRLVRQYKRSASTVFPSGQFVPVFRGSPPTYGADMVILIPGQGNTNPLFKGCLDTNA